MLPRIRNVLQVTGRRCYNVSGTSCKLPKMLQRIRNVLQVTGRRCYNLSGTSCKLLDEDVTTYQERLASYLRCYNVSGTSCKLPGEDVTTYQERLASYWTKMLQRIRKSLLTMQTTGRYNTPPKPFPKRTMCKSDSSPAPRGAPSPKTARPRSSAA